MNIDLLKLMWDNLDNEYGFRILSIQEILERSLFSIYWTRHLGLTIDIFYIRVVEGGF